MATAYLLKEPLEKPTSRREAAMHLVLTQLGFTVFPFGEQITSKENIDNMQTQLNTSEALYASYADAAFGALKANAKAGDVIVATAPWQATVFRGTLAASGGFINGAPVIELWIDYVDSFARFRVFGTHFTRAVQYGRDYNIKYNPDWIVAKPCILKETMPSAHVEETIEPTDPHSLSFLVNMARGTKVIAPDYGAWAELIQHGSTGLLYRTERGLDTAKKTLSQLNHETIVNWVAEHCSPQEAVDSVASYFTRIIGYNHRD